MVYILAPIVVLVFFTIIFLIKRVEFPMLLSILYSTFGGIILLVLTVTLVYNFPKMTNEHDIFITNSIEDYEVIDKFSSSSNSHSTYHLSGYYENTDGSLTIFLNNYEETDEKILYNIYATDEVKEKLITSTDNPKFKYIVYKPSINDYFYTLRWQNRKAIILD